jgi:hypothetical protein
MSNIPTSILGAVLHSSPSDWGQFFEHFRQQKYQQVRSATPEGLSDIQLTVKAMDLLEEIVKNIHESKKLP